MKLSARNVLKGRITKIVDGAVNCEVTLEIAAGVEVVAIITKASVQALDLAVGRDSRTTRTYDRVGTSSGERRRLRYGVSGSGTGSRDASTVA